MKWEALEYTAYGILAAILITLVAFLFFKVGLALCG